MSDIASGWNVNQLRGEWRVGQGELLSGHDLQSAIIISLFTDRLARDDDNIDDNFRRGWWGDSGQDYLIGSRLWLIQREKLTVNVARRAEDYAKEALQWLIDDGVVASLEIGSQIIWPARLNMIIRYHQPANNSEDLRFFWVWETK
ncbi:phage GP46 family protein [Arsenophonus sp. aPb]|uniref:phage GP46 family protein n=1 Tax=Arsenophonus sp. aPb TaxID=3041619 RepID=UPI002468DEB3|nr:phage GP46 family protein [Arsenophonus sp. aPb]WGL97902.1 phage GP46 family protein [Arsenophonus sp. aPb]